MFTKTKKFKEIKKKIINITESIQINATVQSQLNKTPKASGVNVAIISLLALF